MWDIAARLAVTDEQRRILEAWVAARTSTQRIVFRSRIVLLAASGMSNRKIASELKTSRPTVILWRQRFADGGPTALQEDAPGRGRKPRIGAKKIKEVVEATLHTKPEAATYWTVRTMAATQGISPATVQRIWNGHGLEPHPIRTFKGGLKL